MDSFEDENGYEEDEGEESGSSEEEDFDIRDFVVADEGRGNEDEEEEEDFSMDTTSSRKIEEEDPEKLEEKLKKLEKVFSCVPRVLIKRVLCRDDVNGDLNLASQRLQEFQDMENPRDLFKTPTSNPPTAWGPSPERPQSENKGGEKCESQGSQKKRRRGRRGGRRKKNNENQNKTQEEQGGRTLGNSFDGYEPNVTRGNDRGIRQGGRVFGGRPRGGFGPRGGFFQAHEDFQEYKDDFPHGFPVNDYTFQSQRGRDNWRGRWNQPKPQPKPKGRGRRGRDENVFESDSFFQGQLHVSQRGRGRGQFRRGQGGSGQGPDWGRERSVSLADEIYYDELDLSGREGIYPTRRDQGNRGRSGPNINRGRGQLGLRRAQSLSSGMDSQDSHTNDNTGGDAKFEPKKLLICELSESTTQDGVLNFIEAMSGEEVETVEMSKGKALVTMTKDITNFRKIKEKGEKRGMDSARVTIQQVPVCRSILVRGISENTTQDAIELCFESPRNNGGPVETVRFKPKSDRAVVVFQNSTDMERVLARQNERPLVLNKAELTVRIFNDLLENDDDAAFDVLGDKQKDAEDSHSTSASQRSAAKAQELDMAVDPDVMEYVTTTSLHDQLKMALATNTCKINWKLNNKTAVLLYRGQDKSDLWQSECIEEVQTWLAKITKQDVQVNKDFWEAVKAQLADIRACFGVEPPLVKIIHDSFVVRIVSLSSDAEDLQKKLKAKLEDIYRNETRKMYLKKKEVVPVEHLILLKKIRFVEKLQEKNKELEIKIDTEAEEIYFEGPQPQFLEATMKFHKQYSGMVEKKLSLSKNILEILSLDEGLEKVKCELEKNNVEAVFVIDSEARIIGTSSAHADKAASLVSKMTSEEKVRVDANSQHLLKTTEWRQLCEQLNTISTVRVYRNNWNDTYISGFREDVHEAIKTLTTYLDDNCIREEQVKCSSKLVRKYLSELRQDDLSSIEVQLKDYDVKIQTGRGDDEFVIGGNKEGIKRAKRKLQALADSTECEIFNVKQPGLKKLFVSGNGDSLVATEAKNHACVIQVQKQFDVQTPVKKSDSPNDDDDDDSDIEVEDMAAAASSVDSSTLVMGSGHKISWKPGNIEAQQADILVSSQGACSQAIVNAGGQAMRQNLVAPKTGNIAVTPGYNLACNHVIHTDCSQWHGGTGEQVLRGIVQKCLQKADELGGASIAFPVIGAGNLNFPPDAASRIMLEETINFCQTNPSSVVKDIRFAVFQQDQALTTAFAQEVTKLQSKYSVRPGYTVGSLLRHLRSKLGRVHKNPARPAVGVSVEVLQGNLCQEATDVIVNLNSKDMNMDSAGALSKAVKQAAGQVVQDECYQLGHQTGGSVVVTSGGNLTARNIIHLIPDTADKNHLQQCVEKCLGVAEASGFQSISFPAVGTGSFHMSAADSASLIFQALSNFSARFSVIKKVRIVVFQAPMLQAFQREQQRLPLYSNQGHVFKPMARQGVAYPRANRQRGLNIKVVSGDLTKENTDAIMNINNTDMNMSNAGDLSKAILAAGGTQIQQECSQYGTQTAGTAVMTGSGNLAVRHIIHIVPGSQDKQHLQTCLVAGLRLADQKNLHTISIPCVGTGGFGLTAADSAQVTFQALSSLRRSCQNLRNVRVVVFQTQMVQEFLLAQQRQAMQDMDEQESDSTADDEVAERPGIARQRKNTTANSSSTADHSVKILVVGKDKGSVGKAVGALKKRFSDACVTQKVENETVSKLSPKQISNLRRKAKERDVKLEIEVDVDRIVVKGGPVEVPGMVGEIWQEINERNKKIQEEEQAMMVSKSVEWSYERQGNKMVFSPKANGKLEMAHIKEQLTVQISLLGDKFDINLKNKIGRGQQNGETITIFRKVKGAEEGTSLPNTWAPMPRPDMEVHTVPLAPGSSEYQNVVSKFQATARGMYIQKIERIQNPHLYKQYMVRKQKMDKDNGGNSERQLFHGTDAKNVRAINTQGFNRSFCGAHGTAYGRGVYFARDASYSVGYAGGGSGGRFMYLARVLVGQFCAGNSGMIVPPPKNPSRPEILYESVVDSPANPSIFVVFYDTQCYPEYLITF